MMTLGLQLHAGASVLGEVVPVTNSHMKPDGGLWTSSYVDGGSAWLDAADEMSVRNYDDSHGLLLLPHENARILVIDTYGDLDRVYAQYPYNPFKDRENSYSIHWLDYEAISRDYDGMHLTEEGQWNTRLTHPLNLYGWDCECALWFREAFTLQSVIPLKGVKVNG